MITAIVAVVAAVGGGAVAAFFKWLSERKTSADGWTKLYAAYDDRLDSLNREFGAIRQELEQVKEALDREEKRSDAAIGYIRALRRWIGERYPGEDVPPVPESLRHDV